MITSEQKDAHKALTIHSTFLFRDQLYYIFNKFSITYFLLIAVLANLYVRVVSGYWYGISITPFAIIVGMGIPLVLISVQGLIRKGIFCKHTYHITPEEFREVTHVNDTSYLWPKTNYVYRGRYGIFIFVKFWMVTFFIHKRDFQSIDEFNDAFSLIHTYWKEGKKNKTNTGRK